MAARKPKDPMDAILKAHPLLRVADEAEFAIYSDTEYSSTLLIRTRSKNSETSLRHHYKPKDIIALMPALQAWFDEHHPNGIGKPEGQEA